MIKMANHPILLILGSNLLCSITLGSLKVQETDPQQSLAYTYIFFT